MATLTPEQAYEAAQHMLEQLTRRGQISRTEAAYELRARFGDDFVSVHRNGTLAVVPAVLRTFRTLTAGKAVWSRRDALWRWREPRESPERSGGESPP
jgi:hypothetical protein